MKDDKPPPADQKAKAKAAREARLAAALRANLHRRKAAAAPRSDKPRNGRP